MGWAWKAKKKVKERQETVRTVEHPWGVMHMEAVEISVTSAVCERTEPTQTPRELEYTVCTPPPPKRSLDSYTHAQKMKTFIFYEAWLTSSLNSDNILVADSTLALPHSTSVPKRATILPK